MPSETDQLTREIVIDAPRHRVWRALTDVRQFNEWFGVALTSPFEAGKSTSGNITLAQYTHVTCTLWIEAIDPEHHFAFRWHPYAIDPAVDYSSEPTTLVTFRLDDVDAGTRLHVTESGFDAIPESRRNAAFLANGGGWSAQMQRIRDYIMGVFVA